jgi:hypothetical protein
MVLVFQVGKMSTMRRSSRSNDKEHEEEDEVKEDTSTTIPFGAVE